MISALMDLLNRYYQCSDFLQMEAVAKLVQHAIPGEIVSLSFLGFAYLKTGRHRKALSVFRKVRQKVPDEPIAVGHAAPRSALPDTHTAADQCYVEALASNPQLGQAWQEAAHEIERFAQDHFHLLATEEAGANAGSEAQSA